MHLHTLAMLYPHVCSGKWQGSMGVSNTATRISGEELGTRLSRRLDGLRSVKHGDIVLLQVANDLESIVDMITLWHLGAVVVPLKAGMDEAAMHSIAKDCNARFLLHTAQGIFKSMPAYTAPKARFETHRPRQVAASDLALIIYTSGSTGQPKGILLSHNNVITALLAISDYLDLQCDDHILNLSPLSFDYGLYQVLFALSKDCHLTLFNEHVNPITLVKAITRHQISVLPALPVVATMLAKGAQLAKQPLSTLRKLTNTGGHLSSQIIDELQTHIPQLQIFAMYGLTESKRALYLPPEDLQRKKGSVGKPMPGLEAKVFLRQPHEDGRPGFVEAQPNEIGSLFVRGPSLMQGYTRQDNNAGCQLIEGAYREDLWLDTGDLFSCDEDGYFYFKGRSKDLIKQGGYCLYASEIEEQVLQHPAVEFASVAGTHDRFGAEIACLFFTLHREHAESADAVMAWIKQTLDPDYCPRIIKAIDDIKLSVNGKIDKHQLLAAYL